MGTSDQPNASAASGADTHSDAGITELVRAFYEPFRTGDTTIYGEILAEDWLDVPLAPGQEQGPAGMARQISAFRQAMPDYNVTHEDLIVGNDRVAVRNTVSGTHQGASWDMSPPVGTSRCAPWTSTSSVTTGSLSPGTSKTSRA